MARSRVFGLLFSAALVAGAFALPAAMSAAHVVCGQVLTTNTTLDSDVGPCIGDGLVIGASNITVNLAGHTVVGMGSGAGIRIANVSGVIVKSGTVRAFDQGVVVDQGGGNTVRVITSMDNVRQGITIANSSNNKVLRNNLLQNGGDAIRLGLSFGNVVRENVAQGNVFGIGVADGSQNNTVSDNEVSATRVFGISLFSGAMNNRVTGNTVWGTTQGSGISVSADSPGNKIRRNSSDQNADDGIHVDNPNTLVADNSADNNTDLGIEAVPGTKDGGGNTASGNGNPAQCVGVSCN